jgi:hypothetical protein
MARTHCTALKSTGRLPVSQLAPRNVPQPQESRPDIPQESAAELDPLPPTLSEEGSIQGLLGEKGYPPDGDGTPPGCGGGAEHSSANRSARD